MRNNRGIRNGHVEIHVTKTEKFKIFVVGTHPDFIRAWDGWSGMCRHTPKGQPKNGFNTVEEAMKFTKIIFPSKEKFEEYAKRAPSTRMSDNEADDFCDSDILTIFPNALVPLEEK